MTELSHFTNKNVRDKPDNEKFFLYQRSQIVDLTEISAIRSPVMTSFESRIPKNGTFFAFEAPISARKLPQQHHLSQQLFGGHVA